MSLVLDAIHRTAAAAPQRPAFAGANQQLNYAQLAEAIAATAKQLRQAEIRVLGLAMDNTPAWAVVDLAAIHAGIPVVPVPLFFSPQQVRHLINDAGIDAIISDEPQAIEALLAGMGIAAHAETWPIADAQAVLFPLPPRPSNLAADVAKVTYTSGTTGDPKGVCLSQEAMEQVAASLCAATQATAADRHLCLLPLATLLENVAGIYAPLLAGACCYLPGLAAVGVRGAAGLDAAAMVAALNTFQASTCILIPQMLHALVVAVTKGMPRPEHLRYIAVGGAPVSKLLLTRAAELGLPVFEGYGMTEAASVVAVNTPDANKLGSVGRPLKHARLRFADDGEILVAGSLFSGYLGHGTPQLADGYWATGDVGFLDEDGFLHLAGRKKHIFITAFGRNVAPEWVERELAIEPAIAQAAVFGEGRPFNVAVIVPRAGAEAVNAAVASANMRLPDYARVGRFILAAEPFSVQNRQWTGTGRPRREAIWRAYSDAIAALYAEED